MNQIEEYYFVVVTLSLLFLPHIQNICLSFIKKIIIYNYGLIEKLTILNIINYFKVNNLWFYYVFKLLINKLLL